MTDPSERADAPALLTELASLLPEAGASDAELLAVLDALLAHFDCVVGTIHSIDAAAGLLHLRAQRGVPEAILGKVGTIPVGKGMAGIAAERREPVQVCNLQTDDSGVARPGAKLTRMEGSISLPIEVEGALLGTLGVAKPVAYEFSQEEVALLTEAGTLLGRHLG